MSALKPYAEYEKHFGPQPRGKAVFAATAAIGAVVACLVTKDTGARVGIAIWIWLTVALLILTPISSRRKKRVELHYIRDWCNEHRFSQEPRAELPGDTPIPAKTRRIRPKRALRGQMNNLETQIFDVRWLEYESIPTALGRGIEGLQLSKGFKYNDVEHRIVRMTGPRPGVPALRMQKRRPETVGRLKLKPPPAVNPYKGRLGEELLVPVSSVAFSRDYLLKADSGQSAQYISERLSHSQMEWIGLNGKVAFERHFLDFADLAYLDGVWWYFDPFGIDGRTLEGFPERQAVIAKTISALSV